ncbi:MAG: hypothetical protein ACYTGS_16485 [Planctomycetota bacterium]
MSRKGEDPLDRPMLPAFLQQVERLLEIVQRKAVRHYPAQIHRAAGQQVNRDWSFAIS